MSREPATGPSSALVTLSFDDGHPLDLRLAEMLTRHGFGATFYVPLTNVEGLPVMTSAQIRELYGAGFEIGSHTLSHCYLTRVDELTASTQIGEGKSRLEDALGEAVPGFCYPGGRYRPIHADLVRKAGFLYARTITNFHADVGENPYAIPVSIQLYPHPRDVYLRNFVRRGAWTQRARMLLVALAQGELLARLKALFDVAQRTHGVFHLWGHSWELEEFNGWSVLDEFLRYAAQSLPPERHLTNLGVLRQRQVLEPFSARSPMTECALP